MEEFAKWLVDLIHSWGYSGVFITTFLESTFVPLPAELTMVPAGYLVYQGKMNGIAVFSLSVFGSLCGSLFNYYIATHYGRRFLTSYGKYMFFNQEKMEKLDKFFAVHGEVSILTGRLIPGLRHFISFPAGLWRMDIRKFALYTIIGAGMWMFVLMMIGYFIGGNEEMVKHFTPYATVGTLLAVTLGIWLYIRNHKNKVR